MAATKRDAAENLGWTEVRRVFGGISLGWIEQRQIIASTAGRSAPTDVIHSSTRGVVIKKGDPPTEIPFQVRNGVRTGKPRLAHDELILHGVDDGALNALSELPDTALFSTPQFPLKELDGLTSAFDQVSLIQQRTARSWFAHGRECHEDPDAWYLADVYDVRDQSHLWVQRVARGNASLVDLRRFLESARVAERSAGHGRPGWPERPVLRLSGQAAGVLAHELFGHYLESVVQCSPPGALTVSHGVRVTAEPAMQDAISRRAIDDLGRPTHRAELARPSPAGPIGSGDVMYARTGKMLAPEPWVGNIRVCGKPQDGDNDAMLTVPRLDSAHFKRHSQVISLRIPGYRNYFGIMETPANPLTLDIDAARAIAEIRAGGEEASIYHGVCKKGGLFNAYSVVVPSLILDLTTTGAKVRS
jgi:hypothetical protein